MTSKHWYGVALTGYFGLFFLLLAWLIFIDPPVRVPRALVIIILVVPLLLPLRGLLYGRRRAHQWSTFLALPYFIMGVDYAFNSATVAWLGWLEILFSLLWWTGTMMYAKLIGPPREKKRKRQRQSDSQP